MKVPHRVVIIGGGFGGLCACQVLKDAPFDVTLLDRRNFHLFQPLLYQVATGGLSPADIAAPLREVLKRQANTRVLLADEVDFDIGERRVLLRDGEIPYATLIVATGLQQHYFGHDEWEKIAPGLKTVEDATDIRRRILFAFEAAEREPDPLKRSSWLTFVVVGAGATGVELAGAIAELARDTLRRNFRVINPSEAKILLIEGTGRVLPSFPEDLSGKAAASLQRLGVTLRTGVKVAALSEREVVLSSGGQAETIQARTVLWAAGVKASSLGAILVKKTGAELDSMGRVLVEFDLSVRGHPEIFVIGDLANYSHQTGKPLPGLAATAMQQGRYVAELLKRRLKGQTTPPFRYTDKGSLATIGRAAAVASIGKLRFSGFVAWLVWLFVHLFYLVGFENRILVFTQWAWNYFTLNRSARLITEGGRSKGELDSLGGGRG